MSNVPPQGGGWPPMTPAYDPYAVDRAMTEWAKAGGHEIVPHADVASFLAWRPLVYLPTFTHAGRALRTTRGETRIQVVELVADNPLKQAAGDAHMLVAFVVTPRITGRAAVRSKQAAGMSDEISRGLAAFGNLLSSGPAAPPPGAIIGDPTLEARVDLTVPNAHEGAAALPMALRHILVQPHFRGSLELRPGGFVLRLYDLVRFEPQTLGQLLDAVQKIEEAAGAAPSAAQR